MRDTHDTRDLRTVQLIYAGFTRDTLDLGVIYAWYLLQLPIRMIPVIYAWNSWFRRDTHDTLDLGVIYASYREKCVMRMILVIYARNIWFTQDLRVIL